MGLPGTLIPKPDMDVSSFKVFIKPGAGGGSSPAGVFGKVAAGVKAVATGGLDAIAGLATDGFLPLDSRFEVTGIVVNKSVNKIPFAQISISDGDVAKQDFPSSSSSTFIPGVEIKIVMGFAPLQKTIFKGVIIKHSIQLQQGRPTSLMVELKDESVKLTVGRKNKIFENKSDGKIIEEVLTKDLAGTVEDTGFDHQEMVQYFSTDWDFILSRAEANGQLVFAEEGKVNVNKPKIDGDPVLTLEFGTNVYEFDAEMDARDDYKSVVAQSWDDAARETVRKVGGSKKGGLSKGGLLSAAKSVVKIATNPTNLNLSDVLKKSGTPTAEELAEVIGLDEFVLQHTGQLKNEELQAWADAKLSRSRLAKIKGRAKIDGNTKLKPGDMVYISNFSDRFDGATFVSSVTHHLSAESSFFTDLEFGFSQEWFSRKYADINELPASGLLPSVSGLQVGIVKQIVNDPQNDYRIKVSLPLVSTGSEGVWARLATLDAGKKRGSVFLPEVNDEVILGFMNDDPREPVILGMLFSKNANGKPPIEPTETNYKKGFYTKSELKFEFDDQKQSVLIETPGGNKILISNNKDTQTEDAQIVLTDANKNSIEMNNKGITITTDKDLNIKAKGNITIEGNNFTQKATGPFKTDGGGIEINSTANTVIKGKVVQIN